MSLRNLFEKVDYSKEGIITSIMKNKYYMKNAVEFDDELYFEMSDDQGAIRLSKKLGGYAGFGEILSIGGGHIGYYDSAIQAILGSEAEAYMLITLTTGITPDIIKLTNAKKISDSEYKSNHKKIVEVK